MKTKEMTNMDVVDVMRFIEGPIKNKKLPIKLSYAIRRTMSNLKAAYDPYVESLNKLSSDYGCTSGNLHVDDEDKQKELNKEINELLTTTTNVDIYTVDMSVIEQCGTGNYDLLTYEDIDKLWWLIEDEEN